MTNDTYHKIESLIKTINDIKQKITVLRSSYYCEVRNYMINGYKFNLDQDDTAYLTDYYENKIKDLIKELADLGYILKE